MLKPDPQTTKEKYIRNDFGSILNQPAETKMKMFDKIINWKLLSVDRTSRLVYMPADDKKTKTNR